jgi:DNA-binding NarL/FixJ family response regulator
MTRIRILLVDDQPMVLEGIRQMLEAQDDIEVIGEALDGIEALALADELHPDVVLLDINMPRMSGIEALPLIKKVAPNASVVILSMHDREAYILEVLRAGAVGYVLKTSSASHLLEAIHLAASGKYYLYPGVKSSAVDSFLRNAGAELPGETIATTRH